MRDLKKKGFRVADNSGIPVPSRLLLIELLSELGQPVTFQAICRHFGLDQKDAKQALSSRMDRLQNQGVVIIDRKGRYALPDKMGAFTGRVIGHANGYGFVRPDQGGDDLYLHHRQMRKALHGDHVVAKLKNIDARGRKEGVIVEVIVDPEREIVGHFQFEGGVGFVEPDDSRFGRDIAIPPEHIGAAQSGDIVVVKIIRHPVQHHHAVGRICHIMGSELAPGMETEIAIRKHEIPVQWPSEVEQQLERQIRRFQTAGLDKGREDIRDLPLVTIDGEDAKDYDDAVFCHSNQRGWRLVVAIADVSHYVKLDSSLDQEAFNRGNSVYFPNKVVPMLPELLSNGICSLNPMEDRCCMVCDMQVSRAGKILDFSFFPGLMRSRARLTYDAVAQVVDKMDKTARSQCSSILTELDSLYALYKALAKQRDKRGTINFEFPEPLIHFDDQQRIDRVSVRERNVAHRIIEECMLAANVCAGELIQDHFGEQGIYRNHTGPDNESVADLHTFLKGLGLHLEGGNEPSAADYSRLLAASKVRPEIAGVVQTVLLRSLSQAEYSPEILGHFALAYPVYTHFTSPIRRYPDLVAHRLIRKIIDQNDRRVGPKNASVGKIGEHCSFTERRADDATRDVVGWLKAEFMQDKVGEEFDGVVSGVKEFGVFVQLDDVFVDGLIHVTALGSDYYRFDPLNFQLVGDRSGRRFRLGDRLRVRVSNVNLDLARIDFELPAGESKKYNQSESESVGRSSDRRADKERLKQKKSRSRDKKAGKQATSGTHKSDQKIQSRGKPSKNRKQNSR
jgi:ribonuclease R